jgi:hypothetical protein
VNEPTAAEIEAAARATMDIPMPFCGGHARARFTVGCQECRADAESHAARALAAALPLVEARLRAEIAAEIEAAEVAGLEPGPGGLGPAARWGLGHAARIVRGA